MNLQMKYRIKRVCSSKIYIYIVYKKDKNKESAVCFKKNSFQGLVVSLGSSKILKKIQTLKLKQFTFLFTLKNLSEPSSSNPFSTEDLGPDLSSWEETDSGSFSMTFLPGGVVGPPCYYC